VNKAIPNIVNMFLTCTFLTCSEYNLIAMQATLSLHLDDVLPTQDFPMVVCISASQICDIYVCEDTISHALYKRQYKTT
jgi:hypothetical protein